MNPQKDGLVWGRVGMPMLGGSSRCRQAKSRWPTLIGNLKSADEAVRLQAIDQLGARGAKAAEAVAPLTELLKDGSAKVRAHAACALGEIGAAAKPAVPALASC